MSVAFGSTWFVPMVGYIPGLLIAAGVVLAVVLAIYAIYWMIFKMGK